MTVGVDTKQCGFEEMSMASLGASYCSSERPAGTVGVETTNSTNLWQLPCNRFGLPAAPVLRPAGTVEVETKKEPVKSPIQCAFGGGGGAFNSFGCSNQYVKY